MRFAPIAGNSVYPVLEHPSLFVARLVDNKGSASLDRKFLSGAVRAGQDGHCLMLWRANVRVHQYIRPVGKAHG